MKRLFLFFSLYVLTLLSVAQTLGKRDIVFGTDLTPSTAMKKAQKLAKQLANPKADNWQAKGDQRRTYYFADAKKNMPYRVCVPDAWDGESEMPMVLFLHGGWNDESSYLDQNDKQLVKIANKYGVLLVSPLGGDEAFGNYLRLPATFGHEDEMQKIMDEATAQRHTAQKLSEQDVINVIEIVLAEYPVNRSAMYIMGHSMGSGGTWYLGAKYPDYWYGLVPISGPFTMRHGYPWERLRHKPIFMTEGLRAGASLGGSRELYKFAHDELHLNITYKEVDGDHGSMFPMVLDDCFKFITKPTILITEPSTELQHICMAPTGEAQFPDVRVHAISSPAFGNGKITKVEFYDGKTLLETITDSPYVATLITPKASEHSIKVVATDDEGRTASTSCPINYIAPQTTYNFSQQLVGDGTIPQSWSVSNGKETRVGGFNTYEDGPRMLQFTNKLHGLESGLLVQNTKNEAKTGWAKYGTNDAHSTLTLHAGHYALKYRVCNWNQPTFTPVSICIEQRDGQEIASQTYTPTVNIGGDASNKFSIVPQQTFEFDIPETGDYVIAFYTDATLNADFVLGRLFLQVMEFTSTSIEAVHAPSPPLSDGTGKASHYYNLQGQEVSLPSKGFYIHNGKKIYMK